MKAQIVLGLGFGDEGKGNTVDFLASKEPSESVVIRFSGGQQAGHTVVKNGVKHVFSNFGSGTLRNVPTYFTEHCTIYPNTIWKEAQVILQNFKLFPVIGVHPFAKVTTPYDVAYNRLLENRRENKHGSCGLGIGTTMKRHFETGYKLHVVDLLNPSIMLEKLAAIRKYYEELVKETGLTEYQALLEPEEKTFFTSVLDVTNDLLSVASYDVLLTKNNLIFEGSQGILLDMDHGIFPHVTYAYTTSRNAMEICNKLEVPMEDREIYYITRCYQTRHGNGWMSNERNLNLINNEEETNTENVWQGKFRMGEVDYNLLSYAVGVDHLYSPYCTRNLVVTCLDQRPDFTFKPGNIVIGCFNHGSSPSKFRKVYFSYSPESKDFIQQISTPLLTV